jgi:uncharacterized protein YcaQ
MAYTEEKKNYLALISRTFSLQQQRFSDTSPKNNITEHLQQAVHELGMLQVLAYLILITTLSGR